MGQKVNPKSFRLPITKNWQSKWFGKKDFHTNIADDLEIRKAVVKRFGKMAGIGNVEILRDPDSVIINIYSSKPGIIIGRSGQGINDLKNYIISNVPSYRQRSSNKLPKIKIEILEIKNPEIHAQLVAENIALQIEKRIAYKRAAKQAISKAMEKKAQGIKVQISGRLGGAEIARSEKYGEKSVPLGRLKADIDFGYAVALTTYGTIGVKVWIYKGERAVEQE
ncbi:30S ribosomal protein S3 [Candidatus Berkelbacteria bacterium RBG_13_40_8]|uniref:Small ribosomal subunit protein uS3 n=1 Tax=Candidatus Berkelbacteria bacterium RBG_13_40_8 TaxID=1797467 RepID=A0A1F5DQJ9_9BACT|nr:MAG: 30S ribosomal protein S3 [Candidatus Berkelbacteria bacterium RBG_13_40_8]